MENQMKKILLVVLIGLFLATGAALACNKIDKRVDRLTKKLDLSEEQAVQVHEILSEKKTAMKAHREHQREVMLNQMSNVLDEEQFTEFQEMAEKRKHKKYKH